MKCFVWVLLTLFLLFAFVWAYFQSFARAEIYVCNYNVFNPQNPLENKVVKPVCVYKGNQLLTTEEIEQFIVDNITLNITK